MKTEIYPAGESGPGQWVLKWQAETMAAPVYWYYNSQAEAEAARAQMNAGDSGIGSYKNMICAYRLAEKVPDPVAEYYKITCWVPLTMPIHINTYYVPGNELDEFFIEYGETAEIVVDIRPAEKDEVPVMKT